MFNVRKSLSTKLSLSILLMAVPIFVVSIGLVYYRSSLYVRNKAMERAISVLNTSMQHVNRTVSAVETALNTNDWMVRQYLLPDSLLSISRRIVLLNSHVNGCSITTEPDLFPQYGRYFSAYSVREGDTVTTVREAEYEYFDKVWYSLPRDLGRACWTEPFDDYNEGTLYSKELIASYCKPLYQNDGRFIGVISADLSLRRLAETIDTSNHPYPNAYFMLIGQKGHYFIHPDTARLFKRTIFTDYNPKYHPDMVALGHEMTAGNNGCMRVNIENKTCLVCYQTVPGTNWSLGLVCPESDILKGYNRLTYIILPLLLFGLLAITLLCRRVVARAIKPLSRLLKQTQAIAKGNYEVYIPHSNREDAVGHLQNSFATMLESLNFHMGSIRYTADQTKRRNEELVKATRMAEEADRQKTTFIQNMTHQIRTPLNIIMGFAQVLRDSIAMLSEEEVKGIADMMDHNAKTLNRMVLMLLDSSDSGLSEELNSHKQDVVSCNEVARESIAFAHEHFPDMPIHFETEVPDSLCIHTNSLYLMRSIREILYNSAKYSDGKHVSLKVMKTESTVRFVFEDTGSGLSEDYYEYLYVPFVKVNDLSEGLGLGLPLAKRHIQNLGGDLFLDTTYHDGCRFIIELPIS